MIQEFQPTVDSKISFAFKFFFPTKMNLTTWKIELAVNLSTAQNLNTGLARDYGK